MATKSPAPQPWTASVLVITPHSLGAVDVGMTVLQAQAAAGLTFDGAGDGARYHVESTGQLHLYVSSWASSEHSGPDVECVGAEGTSSTQTVRTPEGFTLGASVARLKAIYGTALRYLPAPAGGLSPMAGYVLDTAAGTLAFGLGSTTAPDTVVAIKGGPNGLLPSACPG